MLDGRFKKGQTPHNKKEDVNHGDWLMYNRGCKCQPCKNAFTKYCANNQGRLTLAEQKLQPCKDCGVNPRYKGRRCRECLNELSRIAVNKKNRRLSPEEYDKMFVDQNGCCKICGNPETEKRNGKLKQLAEDHCHRTNVVRGLLCAKHNTALGQFDDNIVLLEAAIAYLRNNE